MDSLPDTPSARTTRRRIAAYILPFPILVAVPFLPYLNNAYRGTGSHRAADKPFIFLRAIPANAGPNQPVIAGVIAAVWDDGTVVRTAPASLPGGKYVQGKLTDARLDRLRRALKDIGLAQVAPGGDVAIDAAAVEVGLRVDGRVKTWAHSPPHTYNPKIEHVHALLTTLELDDMHKVDSAPYCSFPSSWYE